ncbi:Raftlin [Bagarius yarrelli]|uniref:Raftlin n=1 Tax=Bagarius yarrelli TaxID=175774 RepID=A0A556TLS9_BAGYA|nr:Raftlin [Bagarius yarrelli]
MGCGLRKLRQTDDGSPGKIYSTLKRPQVETKIGVTYTYCNVDFLVGKEDVTSTLCLSSVRELPSQLQDLYQQGFFLIAVHPFVHPCGPELASVQRQLYRAVLSKVPESLEKTPSEFEPYHLKLEECLSADHIPTPEHIQGYVKKPSLSLHSSPSSLRCSEFTASPSHQGESGAEDWAADGETEEPRTSQDPGEDALSDVMSTVSKSECCDEKQEDVPLPANKAKDREGQEKPSKPSLGKCGAELFGLFNYPGGRQRPLKYYTVKVPLRVQPGDEGSHSIEAQWLDHMTQHFNNGASLVDGYFSLSKESDDQLPKVIDSVFIFQEGDSSTSTTYDAIVVEQWTIINGVQVKTDYIPLLQSLASFGWRLTCVLPTPIVKTNRKIIFRSRKNSSKNSVKDALKNKKKKNTTEKDTEDQRNQDGLEKEGKENTELANEYNRESGGEDNEETERKVMLKEGEDQDERDEIVEEVEAEVKRDMDGKKSSKGKKQHEQEFEMKTFSDVKNGDGEGKEEEDNKKKTYHLHNGLDEQETSTDEAQDENDIDEENIDSSKQDLTLPHLPALIFLITPALLYPIPPALPHFTCPNLAHFHCPTLPYSTSFNLPHFTCPNLAHSPALLYPIPPALPHFTCHNLPNSPALLYTILLTLIFLIFPALLYPISPASLYPI